MTSGGGSGDKSLGSSAIHSSGLGKWEANTKGFGSKLLEKMGFVPGKGLGKNNEGISEPIVIEANKGRATLGSQRKTHFKHKLDNKQHQQKRNAKKLSESEQSNDDDNDEEEGFGKKRRRRKSKRNEILLSGDEHDSSSNSSSLSTGDEMDVDLEYGMSTTAAESEDNKKSAEKDFNVEIAKKLQASNAKLISDLKSQRNVECGNLDSHKKLEIVLREKEQSQIQQLKDLQNTLIFVGTLASKLATGTFTITEFWSILNVRNFDSETRNHLIQAFGLPILKEKYLRLINDRKPRLVDEHVLDEKILRHLFDAVKEWLKTNPNYYQVIDWYLDWKESLDELLKTSVVKHFRKSLLDLMFFACSDQRRNFNSFAYQRLKETTNHEKGNPNSTHHSSASYFMKSTTSINFKQLIEQKAAKLGLDFYPINGKFCDSKQIFKLGRRYIYLDNMVVHVKLNGKWEPKSLEEIHSLC